jgi:hypothetical protein
VFWGGLKTWEVYRLDILKNWKTLKVSLIEEKAEEAVLLMN